MQCPFCDILLKKDRILKEGALSFAVLSDPRLAPGHTLVIPKRHVERIAELRVDEVEAIFTTLVEFEKKILSFASGCDIRQHYRPFLSQSNIKVDHLHFHLLPREFEDALYEKCQRFEKGLFQGLPEEEREKFTRLLQA